jgi:uncharacterized protein YegP (UPF0339 family)
MGERKKLTQFNMDIRAHFGESVFWHKMPDIPRMYIKRPFDVFCIYHGAAFAFEFKAENGRILDHQEKNLSHVNAAGGVAYIAEFFNSGRTGRNIRFLKWPCLTLRVELYYSKGYNFENLFEILKKRG